MTPSDADLDRLCRTGFVVVDQLIDGAALEQLRDAYDAVIDRSAPVPGDRHLGGITRQVMNPSDVHPVFVDNAALRRAQEIVAPLLGVPKRTYDMLIFKPPGHVHATPWHQDAAYHVQPYAPSGMPMPSPGSVQVWVALDNVDEENGCMHFLPGRHTEPLLAHRVASGRDYDPARLLELADLGDVDLRDTVACPLKAGGATLHRDGTPHYTSPNRSADRLRRAYIFNLAASP